MATDYTEVLRKYKKIIVDHPEQTEFQYQVGTISALFGIAKELSRVAEALEDKNSELEKRPSIKVADGDVWLSFGKYAQVSVEAMIRNSGPIVQRNVRKWRDGILEETA